MLVYYNEKVISLPTPLENYVHQSIVHQTTRTPEWRAETCPKYLHYRLKINQTILIIPRSHSTLGSERFRNTLQWLCSKTRLIRVVLRMRHFFIVVISFYHWKRKCWMSECVWKLVSPKTCLNECNLDFLCLITSRLFIKPNYLIFSTSIFVPAPN